MYLYPCTMINHYTSQFLYIVLSCLLTHIEIGSWCEQRVARDHDQRTVYGHPFYVHPCWRLYNIHIIILNALICISDGSVIGQLNSLNTAHSFTITLELETSSLDILDACIHYLHNIPDYNNKCDILSMLRMVFEPLSSSCNKMLSDCHQ